MELTFVLVCITASLGHSQATEQAALAYTKQSQIDEHLRKYADSLVSQEAQIFVSNIAVVTRVVVERRVSFEWKF